MTSIDDAPRLACRRSGHRIESGQKNDRAWNIRSRLRPSSGVALSSCAAGTPFGRGTRMPPMLNERRTPRVTVADLRRDLREADRRAYSLCTGPRLLQRTSARSGTAPVLLAVTLSSVMATVAWAARTTAPEVRAGDVRVEIETVPAHEVLDVRLEPVHADVGTPLPAAPDVSPTEARRGGRSNSAATSPKSPAPPAAPRRPRPLSPGEFGRETD
jgi:hypothetical protein